MTLQIILRLVHIGGGIFWVGATLFNALFLLPAFRDAGPSGQKVAEGIAKRRFMDIMPVVALLTLASGTWLYARASGNFSAGYMRAGPGLWFGIGGVIAVVAFAYGFIVVRPAMTRATTLSRIPADATPEARDRAMGEAQMLRARAATGGNVVSLLLVASAVTMAIARYM
jgi:uncharacterized membrane protein